MITIKQQQDLNCQGGTNVQNFSMAVEAGDFLLWLAYRRAEDSIGDIADVTGSGTNITSWTAIGSPVLSNSTPYSAYAGYGIVPATGTRNLRVLTGDAGGVGGGVSVNSTLAGILYCLGGVDPLNPILTTFATDNLASGDPLTTSTITAGAGDGMAFAAVGVPSRLMGTSGLGIQTTNGWIKDNRVDADLSGTTAECSFSSGHQRIGAGQVLGAATCDLSAASVGRSILLALREATTSDLSGLDGTTGLGL